MTVTSPDSVPIHIKVSMKTAMLSFRSFEKDTTFMTSVCFPTNKTLPKGILKDRICFQKSKLLHGLSVLVDRPILVSALYSVQLLLVSRKHLVVGYFSFSLFFIGHHTGSKLNETDRKGHNYRSVMTAGRA